MKFSFKTQKQSLADFFQNSSSQKLHNFHWKTNVLESVFNKVTGLQKFKFLLQNNSGRHLENFPWLNLDVSLCAVILNAVKTALKIIM